MVDIIIGYETIGYEALLPACKIQDFRALESYVAFLFGGMSGHFAAVHTLTVSAESYYIHQSSSLYGQHGQRKKKKKKRERERKNK